MVSYADNGRNRLLLWTASLLIALLAEDRTPARLITPFDQLITSDDYPVDALRRRSEGTVELRLRISASGKIEQCTVRSSSGDPVLDRKSCELLEERARFAPARDGGRNVPDTTDQAIRWQVATPVIPFAPMTTTTKVSMQGTMLHCHLTTNGMTLPPLQGDECRARVGALAHTVEASEPGTNLVYTTQFVPEGDGPQKSIREDDVPALVLAEYGIEISEDGLIRSCSLLRMDIGMIEGQRPNPPPICEHLLRGDYRRFEPAVGVESRRGRFLISLSLSLPD